MKQTIFATGNDHKAFIAQKVCRQFGVAIVQERGLEIVEIQDEDGEPIARHKANEAYKILQKPVVITDDTWIIPALNGFPGPYMKSINHWFTPEDWLRLTRELDDRRITLRQIAVYQDAGGQHYFAVDIEGILLGEIRGQSHYPGLTLISFGGSQSIAEKLAAGKTGLEGRVTVWDEFGAWLSAPQDMNTVSKATSQQR